MFGRHILLTNVTKQLHYLEFLETGLGNCEKKTQFSFSVCHISCFSAELLFKAFWQHWLLLMIEKNSVTLASANLKVL